MPEMGFNKENKIAALRSQFHDDDVFAAMAGR